MRVSCCPLSSGGRVNKAKENGKIDKEGNATKGIDNTSKKASGAESGLGKYSVQKLTRDQTRKVTENLLDGGEISISDLESIIPPGTKSTFQPTETLKNGAKYEFQLSDNQKVIIRWHEADPIAVSKYPDAVSGQRWTAQIKVGNKQLKTDGTWTKNQSLNEVHIPIKGK